MAANVGEVPQLKLRKWLSQWSADKKQVIVCAGVYDMITARIALAHGFKCLCLPNAATTVARTGVIGSESYSQDSAFELAQNIREMDEELPLIGELDKSLDIESVKAAVTESHNAGLAAIQIEDRVLTRCCKTDPKKNGASGEAFVESIRAAKAERVHIGSDTVVIAKTNVVVYCPCDGCYSRAIKRLQMAVDAGADVVFMAGSSFSLPDLEKMTHRIFKGVPVMVSPYKTTTRQSQNAGAKIISYPELFTNALYQGASAHMRNFRASGEISALTTVRCPEKAEEMGGLRDLLEIGEENAGDVRRR